MIHLAYEFPYHLTAGTVAQLASARPFTATTGVDNNGDGANNDRPVVNGVVMPKSAYRGTATQEVSVFLEERFHSGAHPILLRVEGFNLLNHGNILGRAQTVYGNTDVINPTFGQVASAGTAANAIPALANIDPPRMLQVQLRFMF